MYKNSFNVLLFCLLSHCLMADNLSGYFVSLKEDTVYVTFKIPVNHDLPDFEKLQWEVYYSDSSGNSHLLKPQLTKEFSFTKNGTFYTFVSNKNTIGLRNDFYQKEEHLFLHLIKQGKVKLYHYYKSQIIGGMSSSGMTNPSSVAIDKYIIQLENGDLDKIKCMGFKKNALMYFPNCPTLIQKIKKNILTCQQIELIVHEYNYGCSE